MRKRGLRVKPILTVVAACVALAFSGCNGADYEIEEIEKEIEEIEEIEEIPEEPRAEIWALDWDYVMSRAAARREGIEKPDYERLLAMTEGRVPTRLPQRFRNAWDESYEDPPQYFSVEAAMADAFLLFNVLRDVYGGYVYFGGDDMFSAILGDVAAEFFLLGQDMISAEDFAQILHRHLNRVVVDNHFWIGDERMGAGLSYFHRQGLYYNRTEEGFRNRATDLYLTEIQGYDIEAVMRLHADAQGQLFYRPVLLADAAQATQPTTFVYEDGQRETRTFIRETPRGRQQMQLPSLRTEDNIPILRVMAMGFDGHENAMGIAHAEPFMAYARQLRDEPVVIVDIRGNGGGNGLLPARWLHALTGEIVPSNYIWLSAHPYNSSDFEFNPDNAAQNPPNSWRTYTDVGPFGEGYTIFNTAPRRIVPRDQLLILLIDRGASSAAEDLVDRAFNVENTLVIGTATSGALAFDATYPSINLPGTGVPFGVGRAMMLWPDGHFAEGVGIVPDIWVAGDALAAALALIPPS